MLIPSHVNCFIGVNKIIQRAVRHMCKSLPEWNRNWNMVKFPSDISGLFSLPDL